LGRLDVVAQSFTSGVATENHTHLAKSNPEVENSPQKKRFVTPL
jgi:hypothetical protein